MVIRVRLIIASMLTRCLKGFKKIVLVSSSNAFFFCRMPNEIPILDFNDTFLDMDHLRNSFPDYELEVKEDDPTKLVPPFRYLLTLLRENSLIWSMSNLKSSQCLGSPLNKLFLRKRKKPENQSVRLILVKKPSLLSLT